MGSVADKDTDLLFLAFDVIGIPVFLVGKNMDVIAANRAAEDILHYSLSEIAGMHLPHLVTEPAVSDKQGALHGMVSVSHPDRGGEASHETREVCVRKKDGGMISARLAVVPVPGSPLNLVIIQDISHEKVRERQRARSEFISDLSSIISSSLSIGTIFRMIASEIKKFIPFDRASLLLLEDDEQSLVILASDANRDSSHARGAKIPVEGTSAGWVVRNNRPRIDNSLEDGPSPLDRRLRNEGLRSAVSIPLFHDRMLGVLSLQSRQPGRYGDEDLEVLLPVARHISMALENALLFEEISREKREWEKTFDAITDMVWIEDGRRRVLRANRALLMRSGLSSLQVQQMCCSDLLARIGVGADRCLCADTTRHGRPSFSEIRGESGTIFHFWAYPLANDDGLLYAIVHYLKEVTDQRRLEQQLIRSDKLASLGTLVAGIAHEINNPLGIIAGYAEALLDRTREGTLAGLPEFEDFPEYLGTIHHEIFRCKDILRSLLDFARPPSGTSREIDINELIKEVILLVNHRAKCLKHNIELTLNRDIPKIVAEPGNLRQLFMNIIINSMYHTPEQGKITISTSLEAAATVRPVIAVEVRDTGAGIPPEIIGKVFDPFFTTKPVGEGTGLGLAICHRIVEEHGGSIDVESDPGKGAVFTIRLPLWRVDDKGPCR